jgi:hypothetical protein
MDAWLQMRREEKLGGPATERNDPTGVPVDDDLPALVCSARKSGLRRRTAKSNGDFAG